MIHNLTTRSCRFMAALTTTLLVTAPMLMAQDAAAAPKDKTMLEKWVLDGGWTMAFIGAAVVAFIALCVFNFINLTKPKFCPERWKIG